MCFDTIDDLLLVEQVNQRERPSNVLEIMNVGFRESAMNKQGFKGGLSFSKKVVKTLKMIVSLNTKTDTLAGKMKKKTIYDR